MTSMARGRRCESLRTAITRKPESEWNKHGYSSPHHIQKVTRPGSFRAAMPLREDQLRGLLFVSVDCGSSPSRRLGWRCWRRIWNWNAYNSFGGTRYDASGNADDFPPTPTVNSRLELKRYVNPMDFNYDLNDYARPLSFDRPEPISHIPEHQVVTNPIEGRTACHLAPTEWRLLGWLERQGFGDATLHARNAVAHSGVLESGRLRRPGPRARTPSTGHRRCAERLKSWVHDRGGEAGLPRREWLELRNQTLTSKRILRPLRD